MAEQSGSSGYHAPQGEETAIKHKTNLEAKILEELNLRTLVLSEAEKLSGSLLREEYLFASTQINAHFQFSLCELEHS
jgi:hypothetical protein